MEQEDDSAQYNNNPQYDNNNNVNYNSNNNSFNGYNNNYSQNMNENYNYISNSNIQYPNQLNNIAYNINNNQNLQYLNLNANAYNNLQEYTNYNSQLSNNYNSTPHPQFNQTFINKNYHSNNNMNSRNRLQNVSASTFKMNNSLNSNGLSFRDGSILYDKTMPVTLANNIIKKLEKSIHKTTTNSRSISQNFPDFSKKSKKDKSEDKNTKENKIKSIWNEGDNKSSYVCNANIEENLFYQIFAQESHGDVNEKELKVFESDEENTQRQYKKSCNNILEDIERFKSDIIEDSNNNIKVVGDDSCFTNQDYLSNNSNLNSKNNSIANKKRNLSLNITNTEGSNDQSLNKITNIKYSTFIVNKNGINDSSYNSPSNNNNKNNLFKSNQSSSKFKDFDLNDNFGINFHNSFGSLKKNLSSNKHNTSTFNKSNKDIFSSISKSMVKTNSSNTNTINTNNFNISNYVKKEPKKKLMLTGVSNNNSSSRVIIKENDQTKAKITATFSFYQEGNACFVSEDSVIFTLPIPLVGLKLKEGCKYSFAFKHKMSKRDKNEEIKKIVALYTIKD